MEPEEEYNLPSDPEEEQGDQAYGEEGNGDAARVDEDPDDEDQAVPDEKEPRPPRLNKRMKRIIFACLIMVLSIAMGWSIYRIVPGLLKKKTPDGEAAAAQDAQQDNGVDSELALAAKQKDASNGVVKNGEEIPIPDPEQDHTVDRTTPSRVTSNTTPSTEKIRPQNPPRSTRSVSSGTQPQTTIKDPVVSERKGNGLEATPPTETSDNQKAGTSAQVEDLLKSRATEALAAKTDEQQPVPDEALPQVKAATTEPVKDQEIEMPPELEPNPNPKPATTRVILPDVAEMPTRSLQAMQILQKEGAYEEKFKVLGTFEKSPDFRLIPIFADSIKGDNLRYDWQVAMILKRVTGQDFGVDVKAWKAWYYQGMENPDTTPGKP